MLIHYIFRGILTAITNKPSIFVVLTWQEVVFAHVDSPVQVLPSNSAIQSELESQLPFSLQFHHHRGPLVCGLEESEGKAPVFQINKCQSSSVLKHTLHQSHEAKFCCRKEQSQSVAYNKNLLVTCRLK